jgi:three-Cys-motif partner protein
MTTDAFFTESTEQSQVKAAIVSKYFAAWAKVIVPRAKKVAYIDLFSGPGRYDDQTKSTPVMVLEHAISDPGLCEILLVHFNDKEATHCQSLREVIGNIPGIEKLKHKPQVHQSEVGEDLVKRFEQIRHVPTLFFVDPWGYKGLSLRLVNSVLKDWGCDCIFFFNYNRISMGMSNDLVREHMNALFGEARADSVRQKIDGTPPKDRELLITEEIAAALKEMGGKFVLPFRFCNDKGNRTSHHLIFVSKHVRGYEIMKDIMAKESSSRDQGVPSLEYNPADRRFPLLFELTRPLDDLEKALPLAFAGRTMKMVDVFNEHHVGTPYVKANYKEALCNLEAKGAITARPPAAARPKKKGGVTFSDDVIVAFRKAL